MVSQEMIDQWKKIHQFVYKTNISGKDYYFTTINRDDFVEINQIVANSNNKDSSELLTISKALLYPEIDEFELNKKAGITVVLSEAIMEKSGFVSLKVEEL